jgi:excisionase family DNA binding protein
MLGDDLLTGASAAARYSGLTPRMVYHLANTGGIPVVRKGRRLFFRKSDLDRAFASPAA